jgi:hypothetical protein
MVFGFGYPAFLPFLFKLLVVSDAFSSAPYANHEQN